MAHAGERAGGGGGRREKDRLTDADQVHRAGRNQGSRGERKEGKETAARGGGNLGGMRSMMGAIADDATPRDVAGREGSMSVSLRKGSCSKVEEDSSLDSKN